MIKPLRNLVSRGTEAEKTDTIDPSDRVDLNPEAGQILTEQERLRRELVEKIESHRTESADDQYVPRVSSGT